jgi:hypothetical protein
MIMMSYIDDEEHDNDNNHVIKQIMNMMIYDYNDESYDYAGMSGDKEKADAKLYTH